MTTDFNEPGFSQHFFGAFFHRSPGLCRRLARLENRVLGERLAEIRIERPVFVCGMARSGSTILLEILATCPEFASLRYCDYPPVWFPYWWEYIRARLPMPDSRPVERAHGDGIRVTPQSPEGFDELFWMQFFPHRHAETVDQILDTGTRNPDFERFYRAQIRKVLLARQRPRYLAKGNYNIARVEYLHKLFPDAKFVIPVRHPARQVASLIRQDRRFERMAERKPVIARDLARRGHFEFGPQKRAECLGDFAAAKAISQDFRSGDLARAYARQWAVNYGYLLDLIENNATLAGSVLVLAHETLCDHPDQALRRMAAHCALSRDAADALTQSWHGKLVPPDRGRPELDEADLDVISGICGPVASRLGYQFN